MKKTIEVSQICGEQLRGQGQGQWAVISDLGLSGGVPPHGLAYGTKKIFEKNKIFFPLPPLTKF